MLNQPATTLNVEALPMEVPESIEADVSGLEMGGALRLEDLPPLEGVTFLDDPHETVIATVSAPIVEAEPEPEEGEELAEGEEAPEGEAEGEAPEGEAAAEPGSDSPTANAPLPSGRERLDAGPARRRSRQPGREHADDRHNAGWMVVDELARRHDGSFRSKFSGQLAEIRVDDLKLALPEAGDVHEPLRQLARGRRALLQAPDRADRGRP